MPCTSVLHPTPTPLFLLCQPVPDPPTDYKTAIQLPPHRASTSGSDGAVRPLRHLQIHSRLRGYTIWHDIDGGWHTVAAVKTLRQTHRRLRVDDFPRYLPTLNPQERI